MVSHSRPEWRPPRIVLAVLRLWPFVDTGDEAHDFLTGRVMGCDGKGLPAAGFDKVRSARVRHPNLNGAQTCGAHPLAIALHALGWRNWPLRRTWHIRLHLVTCYAEEETKSREF